MNSSFFGELLQTITERGRALIERRRAPPGLAYSESLAELCEQLLSIRGEASGVALAREILASYDELKTGSRIAFFETLLSRFGPDRARIEAALEAWQRSPSDTTANELHKATRAAPPGAVSPAESRPAGHGGARAHARAASRRHDPPA